MVNDGDRAAWHVLQTRGWLAVDSATVGERVLFVRDADAAVPAEFAKCQRYTVAELRRVQGMTRECLQTVHLTKEIFDGTVQTPPSGAAELESET